MTTIIQSAIEAFAEEATEVQSDATKPIPPRPHDSPAKKRPADFGNMQVPTITGNTFRGRLYLAMYLVAELGNNRWRPNPPQDKQFFAFQDLLGEIAAQIHGLQGPRHIGVFDLKGGSGKTPTLAELACVIKQASQSDLLAADFNHNTGTLGDRLDVNREGAVSDVNGMVTQTSPTLLFDVFKDHSLIESKDTAEKGFPRHKETGIFVLQSNVEDPNDKESTASSFDVRLVIATILLLKKAFPQAAFDTGNGTAFPISEGTMFAVDVAGFPIIARKDDQIEPVIITMMHYAKLGHQWKVFYGPKIICSTKKKDTPEMYYEHFRAKAEKLLAAARWVYTSPWTHEVVKGTPEELVEHLLEDHGITLGKIFLVPKSKYIDQNGVASVERRKTGMATLIAYARIAKYMHEVPIMSPEEKLAHIEKTLDAREKDQEALKKRKIAQARAATLREEFAAGAQKAIDGKPEDGIRHVAHLCDEAANV